MMPSSRSTAALAATALLFAGGVALATDITEITPEDFYGAEYFKTAQEHPKVAGQPERKQLAMVARDMGWNRRKLAKAVEKVRSLGGEPTELAKKALFEAVKTSRVKGQVLDLLFNDSEPKHVVLYVRWRGSKGKEAIKEASTIAHLVSVHAPFVSTLSLAAIHPKAPGDSKKAVWQGKIGHDAMGRISPDRIEAYADRMYGRMFEEVNALPF